jgi:hypothetical protein
MKFGSSTVLNIRFLSKSVQWEPSCCMRTDGQTDMTKLIVAFLNFANAPKHVSGAWMFVLCVLYSKGEGTRQDNQDKETSTEKVQKENKKRN